MQEKPAENDAEIINHEIERLQQQLNLIKQEYNELNSIGESLESIAKLKKGDELLAPIGGGMFLKTSIEDNKSITMNVGGGVVVKKSLDDAKIAIKKQSDELKDASEKLEGELFGIISSLRMQDIKKSE